MKTPAQRLSALIIALGHNLNSFSVVCNYSNSHTIWSIINKDKKPSKPTLDRIIKYFPQVSRGWILSGDGEMFLESKIEATGDLTVTAKQVIDKLDNQAENIASKIKTQTEETLNTLIVPKMLRHDLVTKADGLLSELATFLNEFKEIKTEIVDMPQKNEKMAV